MFPHLKSLIFVLPICYLAMQFLAKPLVLKFFNEEEFKKYRNMLLIVLTAYFIAPSILVFYIVLIVLVLRWKFRCDDERIYLFVFLSVFIPVEAVYRLSFGPIQTLLSVTQQIILSAILLFPIFKRTIKERGLFAGDADFYVLGYFTLICILNFRGTGVTEGIRKTVEIFLVGYIPFIAISRSMTTKSKIDRALIMLVFALLPVAFLGVFEMLKSWQVFGDRSSFLSGNYYRKEYRAGFVRARSVYFSPITLGTSMMLLVGTLMYFSDKFKNKLIRYAAFGAAIGGSISAFSRMPWMVTAMVFMLQTLFNKGAIKLTLSISFVLCVTLAFVNFTSAGERIIGLVPFLNSEAENQETVDYRSQLIEVGLDVASENILFGTPYFIDNPKMEVMRQGQGIIDMVNTHLTILLAFGAVTLTFFWLMFLIPMIKAAYVFVFGTGVEESSKKLAVLLLSLLVAQLVNLVSTSNIDAIPIFYMVSISLLCGLLISRRKN